MERSLKMQLPRGWYQVAGVEPATFRRHGLSTTSGNLQLIFYPPCEHELGSGEEVMALLKEVLAEHHLPKGTPISHGHEGCAAGFMAFIAYKQIHGQCEYWLIPNDEANVFAKWQAGANATCGMERHDIHEMLRALHFEDAGEPEAFGDEEGPLDIEQALAEEPYQGEPAEYEAQEDDAPAKA